MLKRRLQSANDYPEPDPSQLVPFGPNGGGALTSHPIGLVIVIGILLVGLIGVPEIRLFFLIAVPVGLVCGSFLWWKHSHGKFRNALPFGQFGGGLLNGHSLGVAVVFSVLLIGLVGTPIVRFFCLLTLPAGCFVGSLLWLRQLRREKQQHSLFARSRMM